MENNLLEQSLAYHRMGLSIIPVKDKQPAINWKEFQERQATEKEIRDWFSDPVVTGVGIITGRISSLIVIDTEKGADVKALNLPKTVTAKSGGGGKHFYFKHPGFNVQNSARIKPLVDIRADGGFIVAPPSRHSSGNSYEWELSLGNAELADPPSWLFDKVKKSKSGEKWKKGVIGVEEGKRNEAASSVIGKLLKHTPKEDWETFSWPLVKDWNNNNKPPLNENELRVTFNSIAAKEIDNKDDSDQEKFKKAEILVNLVLDSGAIVFHDQFEEPQIAIYGNGKKIIKINSKQFKRWLAHKAWDELEEAYSGETLRTAIQILEGKACFDSEMHELQVRVAKNQNGILYDLGDGQIIEITTDGWKLIEVPPIVFRRLPHQKIQPSPVRGEAMSELISFINIKRDSEGLSGDLLLAVVSIIAGFIPGFPHPIIVLYGPQGSAKTTLSRIFKELLDPSAIKTLTMPDSVREFVQLVSHHWFIPFDNLADLSDSFSDALCRAVTGDGFSKRELYSDDDDVFYQFQRVICLNGINLIVSKPDLLDRSIIIGLERVASFEEENSFWDRFRKSKPAMLGAIFNVISDALKHINDIKPANNVRMADYIRWGCSITKALGQDPAQFLQAYSNNISRQNEEALDASPVAMAILSLLENQDIWEGTPTELLTQFNERAALLKINTKAKSWPKDAHWLWKRIQEARTNLEARGIKAERNRDEHKRYIVISKSEGNNVSAVSNVIGAEKQPNLLTTEMTTSDSKNKGSINLFGENDYE